MSDLLMSLQPAISGSVSQRSATGHALGISTVRGLEAVLQLQPVLEELARRTGQLGAMDYLEYYLTAPYVGSKVPCLFLVHPPGHAAEPALLRAEDLLGAVLLYEYRLAGRNTGVYVTDDEGGSRTVLAVPGARAKVAATVVTRLLRRRARLVMVSLQTDEAAMTLAMETASDEAGRRRHPMGSWGSGRGAGLTWTKRERVLRSTLPLETSYDATLAKMGKHTRRNLRYFERRVRSELQAQFLADGACLETMGEEAFKALNQQCSYPVPDRVAAWRYRNVRQLRGGFMVGLRAGEGCALPVRPGDWISLLGGRRHHGTTEIGWQMNRTDLEEYSLSTAMRSFLLQYEIAGGAERLYFEGGTPHSMKAAFLEEPVLDLLVSRRGPLAALLRRLAPRALPSKNFLKELLEEPRLEWRVDVGQEHIGERGLAEAATAAPVD